MHLVKNCDGFVVINQGSDFPVDFFYFSNFNYAFDFSKVFCNVEMQ